LWYAALCVVNYLNGVAKSQTPEQSAEKQARFLKPYTTLPYDDVSAKEYGRIRAYLESLGTPIGPELSKNWCNSRFSP
jgi:predicted nucleic acid-binding protein